MAAACVGWTLVACWLPAFLFAQPLLRGVMCLLFWAMLALFYDGSEMSIRLLTCNSPQPRSQTPTYRREPPHPNNRATSPSTASPSSDSDSHKRKS